MNNGLTTRHAPRAFFASHSSRGGGCPVSCYKAGWLAGWVHLAAFLSFSPEHASIILTSCCVFSFGFEANKSHSNMCPFSAPAVLLDGAEDSTILDSSTAPTTPEGSYMSSPLLRPQQIPEPSDMGLTQAWPVNRICCVGAGYVGEFSFFFFIIMPIRLTGLCLVC